MIVFLAVAPLADSRNMRDTYITVAMTPVLLPSLPIIYVLAFIIYSITIVLLATISTNTKVVSATRILYHSLYRHLGSRLVN